MGVDNYAEFRQLSILERSQVVTSFLNSQRASVVSISADSKTYLSPEPSPSAGNRDFLSTLPKPATVDSDSPIAIPGLQKYHILSADLDVQEIKSSIQKLTRKRVTDKDLPQESRSLPLAIANVWMKRLYGHWYKKFKDDRKNAELITGVINSSISPSVASSVAPSVPVEVGGRGRVRGFW